jgi:hemerythrin-like domain-containing protein
MTVETMPPPDTSDMLAVHQVFRDTLAAALSLVNAPEATEADRVELLTNFYDNVLKFLDVHHHGEDLLIFPLLRERAPEDLELINHVAGQHHDVDDHVKASFAALDAWSADDAAAQATVGTTLAALGAAMVEHLDQEERDLLPLCGQLLTAPEWGELPGHGIANFQGDKVWLILGLIRQRMTQEQRDLMLAHMPPPAVDMWTNFGENAFNELITAVGAPLA